MLRREEVAEILSYCKKNKVTYKSRLEELGISKWAFYTSRSKYATGQAQDSPGSFIEIAPPGASASRASTARTGDWSRSLGEGVGQGRTLDVELRMPSGLTMRIQGEMDASFIQSLIQSACGHV